MILCVNPQELGLGDLTRNFSRSEFACKGKDCCGHSAPVADRLAVGLQQLRNAVRLPLTVLSAFRCVIHNHNVGGAKNSYHPLGMAVDIRPPAGWTPMRLATEAKKLDVFKQGGVGIYDRFVHLDVRPRRARWDHREGMQPHPADSLR